MKIITCEAVMESLRNMSQIEQIELRSVNAFFPPSPPQNHDLSVAKPPELQKTYWDNQSLVAVMFNKL